MFGAADKWNGVGVFFDSFDNDGKVSWKQTLLAKMRSGFPACFVHTALWGEGGRKQPRMLFSYSRTFTVKGSIKIVTFPLENFC